jgi:hypothetical protein
MPPVDFSRRHYEAVAGPRPPDDHPVDTAVAAVREVRQADAGARRQGRRMRRVEVRADQTEWVRYEDLLLAQRCIRQERFFDAGYQYGLLAGRAESSAVRARGAPARRAREAGRLGGELRRALMMSRLPHEAALAVLLELARALVVDAGPGRRPTARPARDTFAGSGEDEDRP